jgi:membrane complex biogenesis BtpA family protein
LFENSKPIIGMIHLGALPGTPAARRSLREIEEQALKEAKIYLEAGVHGVLVENMHDTPYLRGEVGPEIVAAMAIVAKSVKETTRLPAGLQILAAANREALAAAHAAGLDFIRAEGFAFAHVADEGVIQSSAAELLRYRKMIGADRVQIWADVKKKHSAHAMTADVTLGETAAAVEFMRGDAIIVTGSTTGHAPLPELLAEAKEATKLSVLLGSGATAKNLSAFFPVADGFIVGSHFKEGGHWSHRVDRKRVRDFMTAYRELED